MPHALLADGPDDYWQFSERQFSDRTVPDRDESAGAWLN